jgi:hypothetical protein
MGTTVANHGERKTRNRTMSEPNVIAHDEFLAMTPDLYLNRGFRNDDEPFEDLTSTWATAAASQFAEAGVTGQELGATLMALKQVLPLHQGKPRERFVSACREALELVENTYGLENNNGLVRWLEQCVPAISTERDMTDFLEHFRAAVRQHALISCLKLTLPDQNG